MSMVDIAHTFHSRRSLWRTLIFSLAVSGALLIGLVTMHSLNIEGLHAEHGASSFVAGSADLQTTAGATDTSATNPPAALLECDAHCEHSLTAVACILALMVTAIVFRPHRTASTSAGPLRILFPLLEFRETIAPAVPPSLHVLSISRT